VPPVPVHCATSAGTLRHQRRYTAPPMLVHFATKLANFLRLFHSSDQSDMLHIYQFNIVWKNQTTSYKKVNLMFFAL
jgi:hypothetical protein